MIIMRFLLALIWDAAQSNVINTYHALPISINLRCRPINQYKCSQDLLPIIVTNLYPILLCNIIDDIQNMIFSMIYRFFLILYIFSYKIHKHICCVIPVHRTTIAAHYFKTIYSCIWTLTTFCFYAFHVV